MSSRRGIIVIGGVAGAVLGATVVWVFTHDKGDPKTGIAAGSRGMTVHAGAPELVKIAVALVGLVRQIVDLSRPA